MKRIGTAAVIVCLILGSGTLRQQSVFADSETENYQLHMPVPQVAQAANGDRVSIMGSGVFSVNPKSTNASGTYTSTASGSGTWVATQLLSFVPYGCRPAPNEAFCGGKLMLHLLLTDATSGQQFEGVLSVFCLIGNPPASAEEGARLDIIGVNNFNQIVSGGNFYLKTT
jgi:hypothetical protein